MLLGIGWLWYLYCHHLYCFHLHYNHQPPSVDEPILIFPLASFLVVNKHNGFLPLEDNLELNHVVYPNPIGMHLDDEVMAKEEEEEEDEDEEIDEDLLILVQDSDEDMDDGPDPILD